ncbi:MAG: cytochrome c oxidase subunit II [Pseudomonadota bacterium]
MRRIPLALLPAVVAALAAAGAALADGNAGFTPRDPASPGAARVLDAYWLLVGVSAFVFLVVVVPLAIFVVRYRSNGRGREIEGPQIRGNSRLEIGWTLGAVLIVAAIVSFVFYKLPGIVDPAAQAGDGSEIVVEGHQFYWRYVYPNGVVSFDALRLPIDREVTFAVTAPDADVIHSFWVPNLAGKRDAIPGRTTRFRVLPTKEGTFDVICGEFCGLQHAAMRGTTQVMPAAEFDAWLADQKTAQQTGSAELGGSMWTAVCAKCHGPDVAGKIGPKLEGNPLLADRQALERIVRQGRRTMPAVGQGWTDEEIDSLVAFTKTLAGGGGGGQG